MSVPHCLIIERPNDWLIVAGKHREHLASDVSVEELVTCVRLVIKLAGLKSPNCLIAPASTSCFFSTIQVNTEPDTRNRSTLIYELESHVPLDAEAMVADFVVPSPKRTTKSVTKQIDRNLQSEDSFTETRDGVSGDSPHQTPSIDPGKDPEASDQERESGKTVSALAIEFRRWRNITDALEKAGILVRSIVPSALLASRVLSRDLASSDSSELLILDDNRCDAVTLESESICRWKHLIDEAALRRHRLLDSKYISRVLVVGGDEEQVEKIREIYGDVQLDIKEQTLESLWFEGASLALTKQSQRWFDLCRDQLGPSDPLRPVLPQVRLVTAATILFLLTAAVGGWWRTRHLEQEIDRIDGQQRAAFQQAFPGSRVPAALLRRVRSEHTKVRGSRGETTDIDAPQSATRVLRELLAGLPDSIRFRIESLNISNGRVDLELQVRTAVDAGALATALESQGFRVEPPITTRKDAASFDSILEAQWVGRAPESETSAETSAQAKANFDRSPIGPPGIVSNTSESKR